ncbi:hypothetical protein ABZ924_07385 [Streptomyces sp. NPDC046876]|uniref:hypothetical protein n=1 Tax=Streptomyces sp. NPDC046876 TaxID=3155616 RepID=UPI0033C62361
MPWTLPSRPSRRSLLAGAAGAAGAALLTGCSGGPDAADADPAVSLERRMRASSVRDSERLLERYDATAAAHPALAERLAPLRAAVAAHTSALASSGASDGSAASGAPGRGKDGAPGSAAPPAPAAPAPGAPAAGGEPVPPKPEEALAALADAERSLAESRTVALAGAPGELARLLASVAACGAVHAYLLTPTPGAAS